MYQECYWLSTCNKYLSLFQSKYSKITSLSRVLQEDPSCQLMTVLRRYLRRVGSRLVEESLNVDTVPQLLTVQKGLLALTRQWKNILYMPLLADSNYKAKKKVTPYTVTFAIPKEDSIADFQVMYTTCCTLSVWDKT